MSGSPMAAPRSAHRVLAALLLVLALATGFALGACGGGEETATPTIPQPPTVTSSAVPAHVVGPVDGATDPLVVAAVGDSITAGAPGFDPDPAVRAQLGRVSEQSQWLFWAAVRMPGVAFRNCGVGGDRTDEIAARLDGCAQGADHLVVQGGVNDIAQGREPEQAAANLRAMVRRGKALGLKVTIVELLPWNSGVEETKAPILELNRLIRDIAEEEDVHLVEWYELLEDPKNPDRMRPDLTADGAHPSVAGYQVLGNLFTLPE